MFKENIILNPELKFQGLPSFFVVGLAKSNFVCCCFQCQDLDNKKKKKLIAKDRFNS